MNIFVKVSFKVFCFYLFLFFVETTMASSGGLYCDMPGGGGCPQCEYCETGGTFPECVPVGAGQCGVRGGGSCDAGYKVDCPAGYVVTTTVVSSVCKGYGDLCAGVGNAQSRGSCCGTDGVPQSCGDWYYCPTPNNPTKMCRDCTPSESWCVADYLITYACRPVCAAGTEPTLNTPTTGQIYAGPSGAASVDFSWNAPSSWGVETGSGTRNYSLCVGTNASNPCSGGITTTSTTTSATASVPYGTQYWGVKANNVCGSASAISEIRNVCVEGYTLPGDAGVGNLYFSQWGACNASTHKRTRTCREDCGTDNCTAAAAAGLLEEDCLGEIRGTIFDATNLSACPSFDPATGYLIGVDTTLTANNRAFGLTDQNVTAPHPWSLITAAETGSTGNYSVRVYAPTTYVYDFDDLKDMYVVSAGPKLTCTSASAVVPNNSSACGTQPCSIVNNMSFGFDRYWSGWWQVVGAGVHGENGIKSSIPSSLPTEQSLILGDGTASNRRGVASYGQQVSNMLGVNINAKVSANLWQILSRYEGVIYDYAYFNQQFKRYATTVWDGTGTVSYDDNGKGYQIFKVTGPVTNFSYNPTGTQKVIFIINGDVTISSNLVVPDGAFMAVISSGNISFGTAVTRADGWFLGANLTIACTDVDNNSECDRTDSQFLGNGSFVSWKGTSLGRDMGGAANIVEPAEKFTYRKDLYENAPEPMKILTKKYKPYVP